MAVYSQVWQQCRFQKQDVLLGRRVMRIAWLGYPWMTSIFPEGREQGTTTCFAWMDESFQWMRFKWIGLIWQKYPRFCLHLCLSGESSDSSCFWLVWVSAIGTSMPVPRTALSLSEIVFTNLACVMPSFFRSKQMSNALFVGVVYRFHAKPK